MDEREFSAFYLETWDPLWRYVRRSTFDAATTDDIVQEAFVKFVAAPGRLSGAAARRYVFAIATNLLRDRNRKAAREQGNVATERSVEQADTVQRIVVEAALAKLNDQERQILWLAHVEGYDHRSIAAIMNRTVLSVRPILFRARKRLLALLKETSNE
jgi:RNA polymerase sigma-70 factor (ECF subfamily)